MKITILGSGTSTGVPQVGCTCPVCTSTDPRDKRLRCSGLIESGGVRILVDCGPNFREQSLRLPDFQPIDGVLITHEHYDHVGGLDDLRPFCHFHDVPVYAEPYTAERLMNRIPYCFAEHPYPGVPRIPLVRVEPNVPFQVVGGAGQKVEVLPLRVVHGRLPILGFRIGNVAWITDMTEMPEETYAHLEGLNCLFMNALRVTPHPTHQSLAQALEQVERIRPREAYFIHASHQLGLHAEVEPTLPPHVHLAYDGLVIEA